MPTSVTVASDAAVGAPVGKEQAPAKIKLTYFGIQAAAEKVRLAFHLGGVDFEDVRIGFPDWQALKPTTPYGQLPFMEIDDAPKMAQSGAMLRYCGRLAAEKGVPLYSCELSEMLQIEEALGFVSDIQRSWMYAVFLGMKPEVFGHEKGTEATAEAIKKVRSDWSVSEEEQMCKDLMKKLSKKLEGKSFLCGESPTIADCDLIPTLNRMMSGGVDFVPKECLDAFPVVTAYVARFMALPAVVKYYESLK